MTVEEPGAHIAALPHADVLARFALALYTPELHNEMVEALRAAGVEGDLDEEVAKFANRPAGEQALIIGRAKALRTGVPTNVIGAVGAATWGPVNQPTSVGGGNMVQFVSIFGQLQNRK